MTNLETHRLLLKQLAANQVASDNARLWLDYVLKVTTTTSDEEYEAAILQIGVTDREMMRIQEELDKLVQRYR